ncbi:glycoside hydrolase [uncultured Dysgonomonas sp.]|uniref:Uncharacterized protein n=1 Tax=uncultured Dysgonomonas sp. TaxID=206096 RepID=A0A212JNY3_9BACT|nr:glycoside hydrolase [uncultured Dysgonomonas sp.]SBW01122.1 conserved exported hypothetical protein [uncultured Dysgonomonas sp.]
MKNILSILFLVAVVPLYGTDFYKEYRAGWLKKAEQNTPRLIETLKQPRRLVEIISDKESYQGWKVVESQSDKKLSEISLKQQKSYIIDFGEHLTGYVSFSLKSLDERTPDSPVRLKFTFGEVPSEVSTPFDPYTGDLCRAWLQDETVTVMNVSETIQIGRRLSFRYIKAELIGEPHFDFAISDITCRAVTSVSVVPDPLSASVPEIITEIDRIGLATLKECMQTVFEDGPKRDQRLWIGDLYLQSMANNYSYRQFDLTRRCLYLVAGLSDENGYLNANVFERPEPHAQQKQFLLEYALLFNATLKDYLIATNDLQTAYDLWPVAKKQLEIVRTYTQENGLMDFERANSEWWVFFDWKPGLHKEVALQGVSIFALKETYELARLIGKEKEITYIPSMVKKMSKAAYKEYYDKQSGLFVGKLDNQISYASQIWMVLSGVPTQKEAQRALYGLSSSDSAITPGTPYLYHYYIQAMINSGMEKEANEALVDYWGGMVRRDADTFWEAYDPNDDFISPYKFHPMNSYCHAWSCTPVYFIRKYPEIFNPTYALEK